MSKYIKAVIVNSMLAAVYLTVLRVGKFICYGIEPFLIMWIFINPLYVMWVTFQVTVKHRASYKYAEKSIIYMSSVMAVIILFASGNQVYSHDGSGNLNLYAIFGINPSAILYMISQLGFTF